MFSVLLIALVGAGLALALSMAVTGTTQFIAQLKISLAGLTNWFNIQSQYDMDGAGSNSNTQVIGTSAEAIALPSDLTTEGVSYWVLFNRETATDFTHYIEIFLDSGATQKVTRLYPGQVFMAPPPSAAPAWYAKSDVAAAKLGITAAGHQNLAP